MSQNPAAVAPDGQDWVYVSPTLRARAARRASDTGGGGPIRSGCFFRSATLRAGDASGALNDIPRGRDGALFADQASHARAEPQDL